jgi:hypothetical protein
MFDKLFLGPVISVNCKMCKRKVNVDIKKSFLLSFPFIKTARKPRAFKPGDEWQPGAKTARTVGAEVNMA